MTWPDHGNLLEPFAFPSVDINLIVCSITQTAPANFNGSYFLNVFTFAAEPAKYPLLLINT